MFRPCEVVVQSTVVKGRPVMGLIPWTSNCRLFQPNDYGSRRQSRPPNQAHAGGHPQSRHCSLRDYHLKPYTEIGLVLSSVPSQAAEETLSEMFQTKGVGSCGDVGEDHAHILVDFGADYHSRAGGGL